MAAPRLYARRATLRSCPGPLASTRTSVSVVAQESPGSHGSVFTTAAILAPGAALVACCSGGLVAGLNEDLVDGDVIGLGERVDDASCDVFGIEDAGARGLTVGPQGLPVA